MAIEIIEMGRADLLAKRLLQILKSTVGDKNDVVLKTQKKA